MAEDIGCRYIETTMRVSTTGINVTRGWFERFRQHLSALSDNVKQKVGLGGGRTPKISVVVPVYNTEAYLSACLDSLITQTLGDIEIICIDDGSTDGSCQILKKYADCDHRIRILHQQNSGAGVARNRGLDVAAGRDLIFLDSDDYFRPDMLEIMYENARQKDTDILICRSREYHEGSARYQNADFTIEKRFLPDKSIFNYRDIPEHIIGFCIGWPWDKLYRTSFIRRYHLTFPALHNSEDAAFVFTSLVLANSISVIDDQLIVHRKTATSLENRRDEDCLCFIESARKIRNQLSTYGLYTAVERSFINWFVEQCSWQMDTLNEINSKKVLNKLTAETFQELAIEQKDQHYFYDQANYLKLKQKGLFR